MEAAVHKVISEFEANPMVCSRGLRSIFDRDQMGFFAGVLPLLRRGGDSPGFQYLLTFLVTQGILLKPLCDPRVFTLDEATVIARRLAQVDSQFDVRLMRTLLQKNGTTPAPELERITSSEAGLRMLDIMSVVSDGTKVLAIMTRLLSHPDPWIRSKAALLVGRSNKNHKWVQQRLEEPDARVRANAVESLWGADNAGSRAVYWSALGDDDHRVVANAVLGLYRLADPGSIRLIQQMVSHPETNFRASGVWVMGETGDPRFVPTLAHLIAEPVVELRGNAFRAMTKLKKAMTLRTAGEPLTILAGQSRRLENEGRQFTAAIRRQGGQPLPELSVNNFAIWQDSVLVREYSVRQRGKSEPLAIALAFPRILDRGGPAVDLLEDGIERALLHKRKSDLWMVIKYITASQESALPGPADEDLSATCMRFTTNTQTISETVSSPGTRLACASDLHQATRALIDSAGRQRAARNIVLVCPSKVDTLTRPVNDLILDANTSGVAVHIISPWPVAAMKELSTLTGGTLVTPDGPEQIPGALEALCGSLLNAYEVRYQTENPDSLRVRIQVYTETLMGEAVQSQ